MLPAGCRELKGPANRAMSLIYNLWWECTFGYRSPDVIRASTRTIDQVFGKNISGRIRFNESEVETDDSLPDGVLEFQNKIKPENPLYNGRLVLEDF